MRKWSIWLIYLWGGFAGYSQNMGIGYMLAGAFVRHALPFDYGSKRIVCADQFEYNVSPNCLVLINCVDDDRVSSIDLGHSFRYQYRLSSGDRFRLSGLFVHNLGFQYLFDSLTRVATDDNSVSAKLDLRIRRELSFTLTVLLTTRLLNSYDYFLNDSGSTKRLLNSAFLTPAVSTLSCGLGYRLRNFGSLNFGISSARFTYLWNRNIFSLRDVNTFYGIGRDSNSLLEYGILLQLIIDRELMKSIHWDCDLRLFRKYGSPPVDIHFKNIFGLRINRYLKIKLQTNILYEERISPHLQMENLFSVGFSVQM